MLNSGKESGTMHGCCPFSWTPVIVGALVAFGLGFLLNLFGAAIGLNAYSIGSDGAETLAFSGLVAGAIGVIATMFGSGWLTGVVACHYGLNNKYGALYGFLAWCLALIFALLFFNYIQQYLMFYGHLLSGTHTENMMANAAAKATATPTNVTISAYIVFVMFFLGAFACSLGGHCGMACADKNCTRN